MDEFISQFDFESEEQAMALFETLNKFRRIMEDKEEVLIGPMDLEIMFQAMHAGGREMVEKGQSELLDLIFSA